MKNTDAMILETVEGAINRANDAGENWAEWVDLALEAIGETLHEDQDFGRDHDIIARLADGREIYCETDGSGGYGITNMVRDYSAEIDDESKTVIRARNISEALRKAKSWVASREWGTNDPVNLLVYGADGETDIDIFPQSGIVCK